MSNLKNRIEKIESQAGAPISTTADMLKEAIHSATSDNLKYKALNCGVWWAYIAGPESMAKAMAMLDRYKLAERLLGDELAARLRAGEDGRAIADIKSEQDAECLSGLAAGGSEDLTEWIALNCNDADFKRTVCAWDLASSVAIYARAEKAAFRRWAFSILENEPGAVREMLVRSWTAYDETWEAVVGDVGEPQPNDSALLNALGARMNKRFGAARWETVAGLVKGNGAGFEWFCGAE